MSVVLPKLFFRYEAYTLQFLLEIFCSVPKNKCCRLSVFHEVHQVPKTQHCVWSFHIFCQGCQVRLRVSYASLLSSKVREIRVYMYFRTREDNMTRSGLLAFHFCKFDNNWCPKKVKFFSQTIFYIFYVGNMYRSPILDKHFKYRWIGIKLPESHDIWVASSFSSRRSVFAFNFLDKVSKYISINFCMACFPSVYDCWKNLVHTITRQTTHEHNRSKI